MLEKNRTSQLLVSWQSSDLQCLACTLMKLMPQDRSSSLSFDMAAKCCLQLEQQVTYNGIGEGRKAPSTSRQAAHSCLIE